MKFGVVGGWNNGNPWDSFDKAEFLVHRAKRGFESCGHGENVGSGSRDGERRGFLAA